MVPIAGTSHFLKLALDDVVVLVFYSPSTLQELLSSKILASQAFLCKLSFNDVLCCDTCMVCSRNPKGRNTRHSFISDDYIL